MTVAEQSTITRYITNGTTATFAAGFVVADASEISVYIDDIAQSTTTWSYASGNVVFVTIPPNGSVVSIQRVTPLERETSYTNNTNQFLPSVLDADLDRIWLALQDIKTNLSRTLALPISDQSNPFTVLADLRTWLETAKNLADDTALPRLAEIETALDNLSARLTQVEFEVPATAQVLQAQVDALVLALSQVGGGAKAYQTLALLNASGAPVDPNLLAYVTNDTTPANNGLYSHNGTAWVKSLYDPLNQAKAYADANCLFKPVLLGSDDLDSRTAAGIYMQNNYTGFDLSAKHYPILENGYLEVVKTDASSYVIQRYFAVASNKVYVRSYAGAWSAWALSYDYVTYINSQPLVKYTAASLDNATNLDSLITIGVYFQTNSSYATTALSYPTTVAGMLSVYATGIFVYQEYRAYTTNIVYRRVRYNGTWQAWVFNDGTVADGSLTQAKLSTTLQRKFTTRAEWFSNGGGDVTYDPTTRVLSWTKAMLIQSSNISSNRINIPAGSITVTSSAYALVYLDLTAVPTDGNIVDIAACIKSATYVSGGYRDSLDLIPMAKIDPTSTGLARPCAGFLPITNVGTTPVTKNPQRVWVEKTATQCSIYVKGSAGNNWICYLLTHVVVPNDGTSPDSNLDLWRVTAASEVTPTFAAVKQIVGSGEWECAINISGETDHVGGYHGDEVLSLAYFVANGVRYAADATFSGECDQFDFVQKSTIYRKNSATVFANHTQYHRFTKDGLRLQQELDFAITINLATAWLGMLPIRRTLGDDVANPGAQVTDRASRYPLYTAEDVSTTSFAINKQPMKSGKNLIIYGQSTGISGEVVWSDFVGLPSTYAYINNSAIYNKVYFSAIASGSEYTVTAGEHWELTTHYRVNTTA